jgi:ABC-type transporter Mla subunit MlaD
MATNRTLDQAIDSLGATANGIADQLIACRQVLRMAKARLEHTRPVLANAEQFLGSVGRSTRWSRRVHNEVAIELEQVDAALRAIAEVGAK